MKHWIKIGSYVVLIALACVFGVISQRHYNRYMKDQVSKSERDPVANLSGSPRATFAQTDFGTLLTYGGLFVLSVIGAGVLFAHDLSQFVGTRAQKALFNDEGEGIKDPDYEQAEQEWANGNYLEAIQMMRNYLQIHPREQWAALRIAEIYEKDLSNYLAAALEYEEVLKQKLEAERWGWAAIHLCNLYSTKLGQSDKAIALLRRIDAEYGETAAAEKARQRLALYDSGNAEAVQEGS